MNTYSSEELEGKAWYRIAKVFYGIGWFFVIFITLSTVYVLQPNTYIDTDKSYFTCLDGTRYNLNGIDYNSIQERLTSEGDKKAKMACIERQTYPEETKMRIAKAREAGYSEDQIARLTYEYIIKANPSDMYRVSFIQSTNGSWGNAFIWAIIVGMVGYGALELIRKITLYISTGKKFY